MFPRAVLTTPVQRGGAYRFLPDSCSLPRLTGRSASTSFTFEAGSSFTRVTACRIACPPKSGLLSRGFDPTSCPTGPLSSFHVYRQLHGWIPPPQVIFAVSAHCKPMGQMFESQLGSHSVFSNIRAPQ